VQSHPAANQKKAHRRVPYAAGTARRGWSPAHWAGLFLALLLVAMLGAVALFLTWDYMPARVQYLPRYIQSQFMPARQHPAYVATPVVAVAPEQALEGLSFTPPPRRVEEAAEVAPAPAAPVAVEPAPAAVLEAPAVELVATAVPVPAQEAVVAEAAAPLPTPAPTLVPLHVAPAPAALLQGIRHEYQGWNNCGPATLAMNLSYYGRPETQNETAPFLKPNKDDKNVSPDEMAAFAHSIGYGGQVVVGMDIEMLRTFASNGIPIVVETWYIPDPDDEMGHYLLLTGYEGDTLFFYDSYKGPDVRKSVADFDSLWKVFNRTAVVVWPPEKGDLVTSILGDLADTRVMHEQALATAHEEISQNPHDKFAWFNLGTNLTALGDIENAVKAFDMARSLELPWRMLWYQFGPYEAYYASGNYQEVIGLTTSTLQGAANLEESFYWRGRAHAATGDVEAARRDLQQAVSLNANFAPAHHALSELP
jgi:tetratricopeptide (TPR) repeat protein